MSETTWKYHPKNPANQPFRINGRKNISKSKAWWQLGKSNNVSRKKKPTQDVE